MRGESPKVALLKGIGASPGIVSGPVVLVKAASDVGKIGFGDILVARYARPDLVTGFFRAAGVITDYGGSTCHAATIAREMGIPCVVATKTATAKLRDGQLVVVDGTEGTVAQA